MVFQESFVSLRLPSSTGVGAQNSKKHCYVYPLRRNQNPVPGLHYCFLTALPLFLHSLPSLISNREYALWNSGKVREAEAYFLQRRNGDTKRICTWESPNRVLFHFSFIHNCKSRHLLQFLVLNGGSNIC